MSASPGGPSVRLRIVFGPGGRLGPGKADLLERIRDTGSIAAAGRDMGMSYRRAWSLVETLNAMFRDPLVVRTRGGPGGGGAEVTETGLRVLALYRALEAEADRAGKPLVAELTGLLSDPQAD